MSLGAYNAQSKSLVSPFESSSSFSFDGSDDFVQFALPTVFNAIGSNDFSVSLWINSDDLAQKTVYTRFFEAAYEANNFAQFNIAEAGKPRFNVFDGGVHYAVAVNSVLNTGQWYHFVGVWDASENAAKLYLDGVLQSGGNGGTLDAGWGGVQNAYLSSRGGASGFMDGAIDEVAIFSSALTAREVDALYNNGHPGSLLHHSTLLAHYRMGDGVLTGGKRDGDQNLLFDQSKNSGLGSELTIADPYAASAWTTYGNIVSNPSTNSIRVARGASGGSNSALQATLASGGILTGNVTVGKTYRLKFDFETDETSGTIALARFYDGSSYTTLQTGSGSVNYLFTAANAGLALGAIELSPNQYVQFSNISFKEVQNVGTISGATAATSVPLQHQNLAPISRGEKSLSFDGSDDFSTLPYQLPATNFTVSHWINVREDSTTSDSAYVWDSRDASNTNGNIFLPIKSALTAYKLRWWNAGDYRIEDSTEYPIGVWQHVVLVKEGTTGTIYVDGEKLASATTFSSPTNGAAITVGRRYAASFQYAEVDISDLAIWDAALSASAIKALYNAGQSTHLPVNTGAYTFRQNLKAYYKMGSGTVPAADNTNGLLFDQTDPGLKAELFPSNPSASDWAQLSSFDWDGSTLSVTDSSGTPIASYSLSLPVGSTYLLSFDITNDGTGNFYARIGDGTNSFAQGSVTSGSYEVVHTVTSSGHNGNIMLISNSGFSGSATNISLKEVKGHSGSITGASVVDNNVPRQIYALPPLTPNAKSLNFDGTNDHLVTQVDTTPANNEVRYYSWWLKCSGGSGIRLWDHGDTTKGAFQMNNGNKPLLYMGLTVFQYWVDNPAQDDGEWHHWTVKIKFNDLTGCELWIDGVKQEKGSAQNSGSMDSYTTGLRIGRGGDSYFNGSIDEFCIFGELSNPEEVARALYNAGRPIDPSKSLGAQNQPQLLRHWWRMGDASHDGSADGTNDILFEGVQYLGPELIENGTYDSDTSGWTASDGATLTVVDGKLRITTSAAYKYAYQSFPTEVGAKYLFSVTGTKGTSPNYDAYFGNSKNSSTLLYPGTKGALDSQGDSVIITDTFTATATTTFITIRSRNEGSIANAFTDFDDVTVKQLRGGYTGPELVKADADLYKAATWTTYGGNVETFPNGTAARFDRPSTGGDTRGGYVSLNSNEALTSNLETGCVYKLQFDFLTDDSDAFPRYYDGSSYTNLSAGSGLKVHYFAFSGSGFINVDDLTADKFVQFSGLTLTKVNGAAVLTNMDSASDIQTDTPY